MPQESFLRFFRNLEGYTAVDQTDFSTDFSEEKERIKKEIEALRFSEKHKLLSLTNGMYTGGARGALDGWKGKLEEYY